METNGDFRKYFDALNKRLDNDFRAVEDKLEAHGQSILSTQDSLGVVIRTLTGLSNQFKNLDKRVGRVEKDVERLENGQTALIKMVSDIKGLESGTTLELKNVRYDDATQVLTGVVREKSKRYGTRKK